MSLSHLQHSDTAAVKDSLPQTPAQGETTVKAQEHKSHNQTIYHLCAYVSAACDASNKHKRLPWTGRHRGERKTCDLTWVCIIFQYMLDS